MSSDKKTFEDHWTDLTPTSFLLCLSVNIGLRGADIITT